MQTIPVLISMNACAHRDEESEEPIAMITSGEMHVEDGHALIRYEETLNESMPPSPVEITVEGDSVSMVRGGMFETSMVFCKGQRYEGQYHTPYGDMDLAIFCTRLRCELDADGGEIQIGYQLDINGQFAAMHEMELHIVAQNK